jgi:tRNA(Ile)-lysidine synthetase-like protein
MTSAKPLSAARSAAAPLAMNIDPLATALAGLPRAQYGVAVSGGADSVALLRLCAQHRGDCAFHVIHLDHQARGEASAEDARFVAQLAGRLELPSTLATRAALEPALPAHRPANPSALFRALRHALFRRVCRAHSLAGVLLAHHRDDQAETVLHRLLRGSGPAGLTGMATRTELSGGLVLLRPLLHVPRQALRDYLASIGQDWREDDSNQSPAYARNVLRSLLRHHDVLSARLLDLSRGCEGWQDWVARCAPHLTEVFGVEQVRGLPPVLAREAGRRWLVQRGASPGELSPRVLSRFVEFVTDAASAQRALFPGMLLLECRRGRVSAQLGSTSPQAAIRGHLT